MRIVMRLIQPLLIMMLVISPIASQAGVWEERALLERYVDQLEKLNDTLLADAQKTASPDARISMNYPAVMQDSNEIIRKIRHHLNSPLEEYRTIMKPVDSKKESTDE